MHAFPLPLPNLLLDNVIGYEMFSFMNGFNRYNQFRMAPEVEKQIAFYTLIDTYYYTVITFRLKNAGVTYQRAIHTFSQTCYMKTWKTMLMILLSNPRCVWNTMQFCNVFQRCCENNLNLNKLQCAFGVSSRQFLGFLVHSWGIQFYPTKIQAIIERTPPTSLKQLQSFLGKLNYIWRFIWIE